MKFDIDTNLDKKFPSMTTRASSDIIDQIKAVQRGEKKNLVVHMVYLHMGAAASAE